MRKIQTLAEVLWYGGNWITKHVLPGQITVMNHRPPAFRPRKSLGRDWSRPVLRMVWLAVLASFGFGGWLGAQTYSPPASHRADVVIDAGWRFIQQDVSGAQTANFDDSSWSNLNLPHTWDVAGGQDGPGTAYYRGVGWYRTHYAVDGSLTNRHFFVKFDGAFSDAQVWINGNYLGEHQGGFAAFAFDVTPYANVGTDNVVAVRLSNAFNTNLPPLNADFTFFGGLYRDVHWLVTDPVQISPLDYGSPGVYLTPTGVSSNSANLQVTTVVSNATAQPQTVTVRATVTDAASNIVTTLTNLVTLPAASVSNVVASTTIARPHLWNGLADPYLYQTFVELDSGTNVADAISQPLGFRYYSVDPTNGFFLNGRHYDLHGVNMHQDWLNCGWADNIHATYPSRCVGVSEYGAGASIYQHSENPTFPANTASSFHPEEWQNLVIETNWQMMAARPFLWCKLVWTSFDFASDGRNEGDTPGRNDKGMVTYDRQVRKDAFYFFKANWTTNPMVYITGHTFTNRQANNIVAKAYANCSSVQLFLNGVPQGSTAGTNGIYTWPVQLQSGTNFVQAVGVQGGINVTDALVWIAPVSPPGAAIINPATPTIFLGSTNGLLPLSATATDYQTSSPAPLVTTWSQTGGPGTVVFGNAGALNTTAGFSTNGVYTLQFQAAKGALVTNVGLTVVVGPVPYGPVEQLRFAFDDAGPGTSTPSDTSGGGVNVALKLFNSSGALTDYHGAAGSGVAGLTTGSRALNFSANSSQGGSGPIAAITNTSLAFGNITNFTATMWFKQTVLLPANIGPRMFLLGNGTNSDCGTANSIGMKFQDASDLWFFVNTNQATASFGTSLPLNSWIFVAMTYDGTNISLYEGSDQSPATLVSLTPAAKLTVPLGAAASLDIGNRRGLDRDFAGWIDDFRFYQGAGDLSFVESVRQSAAGPSGLAGVPGNNQVALTWNPLPGATSYNLKRSAVSGGPYTVITSSGLVTATNYLDSTATNGGTYYYAISAVTSISEAGETANGPTEAMVTLPVPPPAPVAGWNSPLYAGMTLHLTASTVSGAAYNWSGPGGFSATVQNPSLAKATPVNSGVYNVIATVGGAASPPASVNVLVNPPVDFTVRLSPAGLIFNWPYGTLESASNLFGPWLNLNGAVSPYTNPLTGPQGFYRIQLQ